MALTLPTLLQSRLEALADSQLRGPGVPTFDFTAPPGAPALMAPDSVSWRVFRNPVTLFIGGVAAVLLELAEPRVRHGVWDHSDFRTDPLGRLRRTGLAAMVTVYGAAEPARAMIAGISRRHAEIRGVTAGGIPYRADDPELLTWVQATAAWGFVTAYSAYAEPLPPDQLNLFFAEGAPVAALYGAPDAPASASQWETLLAQMLPRIEPSPIIDEFLGVMRRVPVAGPLALPVQRLLVRAAMLLLPGPVPSRLGLHIRPGPHERLAVRALARAAGSLALATHPANLAGRRLAGDPERAPAPSFLS